MLLKKRFIKMSLQLCCFPLDSSPSRRQSSNSGKAWEGKHGTDLLSDSNSTINTSVSCLETLKQGFKYKVLFNVQEHYFWGLGNMSYFSLSPCKVTVNNVTELLSFCEGQLE